jgi:hypothetical protein
MLKVMQIQDASLGLYVASKEGRSREEKENDNPETPATTALTKKNHHLIFCFCWTR